MTHEIEQALKDLLDSYEQLIDKVDDLQQGTSTINRDVGELARQLHGHLSVWDDVDQELEQWVEGWLIPTFALDSTLAGWQDSPAERSELHALRIGYQQMAQAGAAGFDPLAWHDYLDRVIARIPEHRRRRTQLRNAPSLRQVPRSPETPTDVDAAAP